MLTKKCVFLLEKGVVPASQNRYKCTKTSIKGSSIVLQPIIMYNIGIVQVCKFAQNVYRMIPKLDNSDGKIYSGAELTS